jgi:hypothetical protein
MALVQAPVVAAPVAAPAAVLVPVDPVGNCPPGLAKKHNGCLPPGHAR